MLNESLYHPPKIEIVQENNKNGSLYLNHVFEGKPLIQDFISNSLLNISKLWGNIVELETNEIVSIPILEESGQDMDESKIQWKRVVYKVENNKITKRDLA